MLKGNILDCYPEYNKNTMVIWLSDKNKAYMIKERYEPSFYVNSSKENLYLLSSMLNNHHFVKKINFTFKRTDLFSKKEKIVLEVFPKNIGLFKKTAELIDRWGGFYKHSLFNVDIRFSTRFLEEKNVFFNAQVKYNNKTFFCNEDQWSTKYNLPDYKKIFLDAKQKQTSKKSSFDIPVSSVLIGNYIIAEENEIDTLLSAINFIRKTDPDIIITKNGDSFLLPYLFYRAKKRGISHLFNLGREKQNNNPSKKEKSYFSYGKIIYRPPFYILKGRIHIDKSNYFFYGESGFYGLLDISRCSNIPLQLLSRLGPGTAISQIQVNKAIKRGYLVPWKKNIPETWKNGMDLLTSDRGGIILEPKTGIHEDIIELDFSSLYPNIMLNYNISPETILCDCCKKDGIIVPQLGYHICAKKQGLIPEVLKPIIHRRFFYKARSKNKKYDKNKYYEMQTAWKWVLLVCFGYTGYKNARYGRIECHESITAFSRDILLKAIRVSEENNYKVLHGIIDSLWVKPQKNCTKPISLSRKISNKTGIRMDIEGHYKWIVFLPCKNNNIGALNRYYGLFDNGEIKIRGIELRQHSTPIFLKDLQKEILDLFSKADNKKEFLDLIPFSIEIIKKYAKKIINLDLEPKTLLFKSHISRNLSAYKVNTIVKSALMQYKEQDINFEPGQCIRYLVTDQKSKNYKKRVTVDFLVDETVKIDIDFYLKEIAKCAESILIPFDYSKGKIEKILLKIKKREMCNVSILPRT